jgi:hypothetical protein
MEWLWQAREHLTQAISLNLNIEDLDINIILGQNFNKQQKYATKEQMRYSIAIIVTYEYCSIQSLA